MTVSATLIDVRCVCNRLLFKVTSTGTGMIEIKCRKCGIINEVYHGAR